jgi:hypothetical protein
MILHTRKVLGAAMAKNKIALGKALEWRCDGVTDALDMGWAAVAEGTQNRWVATRG